MNGLWIVGEERFLLHPIKWFGGRMICDLDWCSGESFGLLYYLILLCILLCLLSVFFFAGFLVFLCLFLSRVLDFWYLFPPKTLIVACVSFSWLPRKSKPSKHMTDEIQSAQSSQSNPPREETILPQLAKQHPKSSPCKKQQPRGPQ